MLVRVLSTLGALAATAATVAFATPAAAQVATRTAIVSIVDLDLAKPADTARLERRLRAAAREACGPDGGLDINARLAEMACEKTALSRARADVQVALRGRSGTQVALTTN